MAPLHSCICCLILLATSVVSQNVNGYRISRQILWLQSNFDFGYNWRTEYWKIYIFWKVQKNRVKKLFFPCLKALMGPFLQNTKVQKLKLSENLNISGMYKNFVIVFTLSYIFRCIIELVHTYPVIYNLLLHIWVFMYYVCIVIYIGMLKLGHGIHLCKFCTIHL